MQGAGKNVALVVAAGIGSRAGEDMPKQYRKIAGKPLLAHALEHLRHPLIDEVRVVIGPGQEALYRQASGSDLLPPPATGGSTRRESVRNGLEALAADGAVARVLIHDAARPFLPAAVIERLLDRLDAYEGAVPALPVADTLLRFDGRIGDTVSREKLFRVQTPQAFVFDAVLAAHRSWTGDKEATDDAQMVRDSGREVTIVEGDPLLEKITYPSDFAAAEERLARRMVTRVGQGFDVHAFASGEQLWLGGLLIPHSKGLKGHSDADVALHALTDALLGAAGAGDIGDHFPPSDPQWRGAASSRFVEHARELIDMRGGRIDHVDLTIICETPRIGPYKSAMKERVAGLLRLAAAQVSIKATTTERLGFTGRGEGIAAQAIATIRLPERP